MLSRAQCVLVTQALMEWLDSERNQTYAAQRARIETTKLLATFSSALAATVVATALQVSAPNALDQAAVWLLLLTALGAVVVILLDRTREVDTDALMRNAHLNNWSPEKSISELREAGYIALNYNRTVVTATRIGAALTAVFALAAGVVGTLSLLQAPA